MVIKKIKLLLGSFYKIPFLVPYWNYEERNIILKSILGYGFFERGKLRDNIKKIFKVKYAYDFNMGRSALEIGLLSLGLKKGDEVILSTYSCRGVIEPILKIGCVPVLVDIDEYYNISPKSIQKNITKKTKAIIMSHLFGAPAKVKEIQLIADKYKLFLIDDAAQVVGLEHNYMMAGTFGDIGILSFGIGKSISATEGGFLITNRKDLAEVINSKWILLKEEKRYKTNLRAIRCWIEFKWRKFTNPFFLVINRYRKRKDYEVKLMSQLDCAIVQTQLNKLKDLISIRRSNCLDLIPNKFKGILLPKHITGHIYSKFVLEIKYSDAKKLSRFLRLRRIESELNYKPLHLYSEFKKYQGKGIIIAPAIWNKLLSIPNQANINNDYIINTLKEYE